MTRVIKILINHIFENYDILRIYAEPFERNIASRRVLEKNNFILEAILKSSIYKNELVENSCIYSLLKNHYNRLKE